MRAFDNWNSYIDNDGNLLHGKIRFCRKGTTDNIIVYNSDDTPIRNPEFTDMLGRTEFQVFVENGEDVTAYFYKYVGTGDMMHWPLDDYDPERWSFQYSSDNMDSTSTITINANTSFEVATMEEFRALNPEKVPSINGQKFVWVNGYYTPGDKSPVLYVWDSASLDSDDGGATIMSMHVPGQGRWKLATRELHFDVRHFGVFPVDDKYSNNYTYTSQLANCAAYIDNEGLDAWFPALNDSLSYYLFDGTNTFSISNDIYISDAVRFQVKTGTTNTAIMCNEIHKTTPYLFDSSVQTGLATLTCNWVNISWVGGNCTGNARVGWIIDVNDIARIIGNKEVKFITNGSPSLQLNNCDITSYKQITGEITIENSVIKSEFFADDYNYSNLRSSGNIILVDNFFYANTYIDLKNKQNDKNYGDLRGKTISGKTLLEDCYLSNANLDNVTVGSFTFDNVTGSINVDGTGKNIVSNDSFLTVLNQPVLGECIYNGGEITSSNTLSFLRNVSFDNSKISAQLEILGGVLSVKTSDINQKITQKGMGTISQSIQGCNLSAQVKITATVADTVLNAVWTNNYSSITDPIDLDRVNLEENDSAHVYVYEGNSGGFLPKDNAKLVVTLRPAPGEVSFYKNDDRYLFSGAGDFSPIMMGDLSYKASDGGKSHGLSPFVKLFRVGYDDFPVKVSWECTNKNVIESGAYAGYRVNGAMTCVDFIMMAVHRGGYEYKLNLIEQAPTTQDAATVAFTNIGYVCNREPTQSINLECIMFASPL